MSQAKLVKALTVCALVLLIGCEDSRPAKAPSNPEVKPIRFHAALIGTLTGEYEPVVTAAASSDWLREGDSFRLGLPEKSPRSPAWGWARLWSGEESTRSLRWSWAMAPHAREQDNPGYASMLDIEGTVAALTTQVALLNLTYGSSKSSIQRLLSRNGLDCSIHGGISVQRSAMFGDSLRGQGSTFLAITDDAGVDADFSQLDGWMTHAVDVLAADLAPRFVFNTADGPVPMENPDLPNALGLLAAIRPPNADLARDRLAKLEVDFVERFRRQPNDFAAAQRVALIRAGRLRCGDAEAVGPLDLGRLKFSERKLLEQGGNQITSELLDFDEPDRRFWTLLALTSQEDRIREHALAALGEKPESAVGHERRKSAVSLGSKGPTAAKFALAAHAAPLLFVVVACFFSGLWGVRLLLVLGLAYLGADAHRLGVDYLPDVLGYFFLLSGGFLWAGKRIPDAVRLSRWALPCLCLGGLVGALVEWVPLPSGAWSAVALSGFVLALALSFRALERGYRSLEAMGRATLARGALLFTLATYPMLFGMSFFVSPGEFKWDWAVDATASMARTGYLGLHLFPHLPWIGLLILLCWFPARKLGEKSDDSDSPQPRQAMPSDRQEAAQA